ncbi:MAG: AAA family ATPase [Gammaproteobacteria bacterium]|nr:AAA family ATPase [Gammaproteobacteria bacterium]
MYLQFFGLNEKPFAITPDPRYLYMSARHADALAHLLYGISESGGFIQLTGEIGTGKTTLVRSMLEQAPENADIALILNPQVTATEFLQGICDELGIAPPEAPGSTKALVDALNTHLLAAHARGRRTVLVVDEAQNLRPEVLEQVRLLTNLETARQKLLQIILIGQPELRELLDRHDLRQLAQRITGRYHLEPLDRDDTARYVEHRLRVAGAPAQLFTAPGLRELYARSGGVPRLINILADRALLGAYSRELPQVDRRLVRQAAREVFDREGRRNRRRWLAAPAALAAVLVTVAAWQMLERPAAPDETPESVTTHPIRLAGMTPAAAPMPPPGIDLVTLEQLLSLGMDTSTDGAFATLFGLWETPYRRGEGLACEQADRHGLACLFQRGSLSHLMKLGRPSILNLVDGDGTAHQVVLTAVDGDAAEVGIEGERFWISVPELSDYWFGDYLLLWRPDGDANQTLRAGMRDPRVVWLRGALAALTGEPLPPEESPLFDESVEARVREYQRSRRLAVDGLVGPRTLIILQSELDDGGAPRLAGGG